MVSQRHISSVLAHCRCRSQFRRPRIISSFPTPRFGCFHSTITLCFFFIDLNSTSWNAPRFQLRNHFGHCSYYSTTIFYLTVTWIESHIPYIYITCVFLNLTMAAFWAWWWVAFKHHPQLFVTPVGFSLIFITYLNRSDLSLEMMRRFRSFAGVIIYASSFAELFTATGLLSPIILAVMCVLGILVGIALRIRHFLCLGTISLLLDIMIQIFEVGKGNA